MCGLRSRKDRVLLKLLRVLVARYLRCEIEGRPPVRAMVIISEESYGLEVRARNGTTRDAKHAVLRRGDVRGTQCRRPIGVFCSGLLLSSAF